MQTILRKFLRSGRFYWINLDLKWSLLSLEERDQADKVIYFLIGQLDKLISFWSRLLHWRPMLQLIPLGLEIQIIKHLMDGDLSLNGPDQRFKLTWQVSILSLNASRLIQVIRLVWLIMEINGILILLRHGNRRPK